MSRIRLATEYALAARILARDFHDRGALETAKAAVRPLARLEDSEAGFLKARVASFIKSAILNADIVPPEGGAVFRDCLLASANLLLILPDAAALAAPDKGPARRPRFDRNAASGGETRRFGTPPVPERD